MEVLRTLAVSDFPETLGRAGLIQLRRDDWGELEMRSEITMIVHDLEQTFQVSTGLNILEIETQDGVKYSHLIVSPVLIRHLNEIEHSQHEGIPLEDLYVNGEVWGELEEWLERKFCDLLRLSEIVLEETHLLDSKTSHSNH